MSILNPEKQMQKIVDGVNTNIQATVLLLSNASPVAVAIVDGTGAQISSFGGGTQYTDGGTPPTHPVGTMPIFNNAGAWAQVSNTVGLPVNIVSGSSAGTQYTQGGATVANPTGTAPIYFDGSGNPKAVTTTQQLPVSATLNAETTKVIGTVNQGTSPWTIQGATVGGATDAGNPVKVGGKFNTARPTYSDGQATDLQTDSRGNMFVLLGVPSSTGNSPTMADNTDGVAVSATANKYSFLSRNTLFNGTTWDRAYGTTNGAYVQGVVADAIAIAGNPIPIGAVYETAPPTYTAGQRSSIHTGSRGSMWVSLKAEDSLTGITAKPDNADGVAVISSSSFLGVASSNRVFNGTTWDRMPGSTTGVYNLIRDGAGNSRSAKVDGEGNLGVSQKAPTSVLTNVAGSATNVTLLASNTARISAVMYNDSTQIAYVKYGTTASSTSFTVPLASGVYYEVVGGYTGQIDAVWVSANGNMRITEIS